MSTPYYDEAGITIYHCDGLEWLADHRGIDAIVTDPPYGVGVDYGGVFDDSRSDYWEWMNTTLGLMRATSRTVTFTHRVAALRQLSEWDWIAVWNKPLAMSGLNHFPIMPHWEPIFLYGIAGRGMNDLPRHFDVVSVNPAHASESRHPCPKPVGLYRELVRWTQGVVVDPFMGSGTTLRAAKDMGRQAIGIELDERWCELAARRLGQEVLAL